MEDKLCAFPKFSQIFGKPMEGLHKYRIFGVAAFDLLATLFVAFLITMYIPPKGIAKNKLLTFVLSFIALVILGVFLHTIFCVPTPFTRKVWDFVDRL